MVRERGDVNLTRGSVFSKLFTIGGGREIIKGFLRNPV